MKPLSTGPAPRGPAVRLRGGGCPPKPSPPSTGPHGSLFPPVPSGGAAWLCPGVALEARECVLSPRVRGCCRQGRGHCASGVPITWAVGWAWNGSSPRSRWLRGNRADTRGQAHALVPRHVGTGGPAAPRVAPPVYASRFSGRLGLHEPPSPQSAALKPSLYLPSHRGLDPGPHARTFPLVPSGRGCGQAVPDLACCWRQRPLM